MKTYERKRKASGGLNMPQEGTDEDDDSHVQSEEPSEEPTEEPSEESDEDPSKEPSEESVSQPSSGSDNDDAEHQSKYVQADSDKNKRPLNISAGQEGVLQGQSQKKYKEPSVDPDSDTWPATNTTTNLLNKALVSVGDASEGQEKNSSVKRRRSRWEPQLGDEVETDETCKKRKTRWAGDDSQLKMLGPIQFPDFVKGLVAGADFDPEIRDINMRLLEINKKLQGTKVLDERPQEERSPSPPPLYNNLGIRTNPREVRLREKLIQERQEIISRLIQKNPIFKPPSDYKPPKFYKKLYVPQKEYPGYNFIGLIIGPRGNTQKRMEKESGAKILIRGKGSFKDGRAQQRRDMKPDPSESEDLHVLVEADSQKSLDAAVGMVEKLLVPVDEGMNEHKRAQLKELAVLNGTLKDGTSCRECELRHTHVCPSRNLIFKMDAPCNVCGDGGHPTSSCPLTASDSGNKLDYQCHSFLSDIGGGSAAVGVSPIPSSTLPCRDNPALSGSLGFYGSYSNTGLASTAAPESKPNKEIDDSNLYVGHLPPEVDENQLIQLFSPFGRIASAKVIKDRTTGLSKCYGFVKYTHPVDAAKAVEHMNEHKISGKVLAVRVAGRLLVPPLSSVSGGNTAMYLLPPYPGPPSVPQDHPGQSAWPGPPGSLLPETWSSFTKSDAPPPVYSGKNESFSRQLPSYHCQFPISSSNTLASFPSDLTGSTDHSLKSDSVNKQLLSSYGSSSYKIPISGQSMPSQLPCDLSSSPNYLGQSDLFIRHSPSFVPSYQNPVSSSSTLANFPGNLRSSPGFLNQTDSFSRQSPSHWSPY